MAINKVVYNNETLIDLTSDTVELSDVLAGKTVHLADGSSGTGTCEFDVNSSNITPGKAASASEILAGEEAYVNGAKVTGTMPDNGAITSTIRYKTDVVTIPAGYHDGSGTVQLADAAKAELIADHILKDTTIMGVTGTLDPGSEVTSQTKTVSAPIGDDTATALEVTPDTGYQFLSKVTVNPVKMVKTLNSANGYTATISAT